MRRASVTLTVAASLLLGACGSLEFRDGRFANASSSRSSSRTASLSTIANAASVIVEKGDTVYGLSRRYRVSSRDIIVANDLRAPYILRVGQRILLPRGKVHTVRSGETLYRIANTYDATVYEIARANNISPPYTIFVDQKLRIPGTVGAQQAVTTKATTTPSKNAISSKSTKQPSVQTASVPAPMPKPKPPKAVPKPPPASGSGFNWPTKGKIISSFGAKGHGRFNDGINIAASEGSQISAAENGVVAYAGNELRGFGNLVLIKHSNGYVTAYAHASEVLVKRGDKVKRGQAIALVGSTGNITTPQLHFEVRKGKRPLNPVKYLPASNA